METATPLTIEQVANLPWQLPAMVAAATVYRARTGRRRAYQSERDAKAYDDGWSAFPNRPPVHLKTPFADGYFDHESQSLDNGNRP